MKYTIETNITGNWEIFEDWREYKDPELAKTVLWVLVRDLQKVMPEVDEKNFRIAEKTS